MHVLINCTQSRLWWRNGFGKPGLLHLVRGIEVQPPRNGDPPLEELQRTAGFSAQTARRGFGSSTLRSTLTAEDGTSTEQRRWLAAVLTSRSRLYTALAAPSAEQPLGDEAATLLAIA